ncbi:hypothetical protein COU54_04775 [Candidatus Pacearchaeota archaeon CG10_big_fil_rev_8_21_14_0_10_31_24]|nr:MAG: hypothetical protein COU54_04775 [Candidatus Pacearchaeota archaeon CG10_big_fil_rev_8_21_14_0_10_31_24]
MNLVADTNILFSLCNKNSTANLLTHKHQLNLFSLNYALLELEKYKETLIKKSNQSFTDSINLLKQLVQFINVKDLKKEIQECKFLTQDLADIPFLALAKHLNITIWSNDSHLKEQSLIQVFSTLDLLKLLPLD